MLEDHVIVQNMQTNGIIEDLPYESVMDINQLQFMQDDFDDQMDGIVQQQYTNSEIGPYQPKLSKIDLDGEFYKVSPHLLESNQRYYCTLQFRRFTYYSIHDKSKQQGILDFDQQKYTFTYTQSKDGLPVDFCFIPEGYDKKFMFVIPSKMKEQFKQWIRLIHTYLTESEGTLKELTSLRRYFRFWRHERILNHELTFHVKTGDLMIFRTRNSLSGVQRSITRSEYDHIVMFLREPNGQITLLESSNQYGVITFSYTRFVRACSYKNYEKIIFKQLLGVSQDDRNQMVKLSEQQVGKGYSLSMMKFLKKTSKRNNFFCSELIAYIYQAAGLIDKSDKCCNFLPGNFTDEKQRLQLTKGASLSQDYIIDYYH